MFKTINQKKIIAVQSESRFPILLNVPMRIIIIYILLFMVSKNLLVTTYNNVV